MFVELNKAERFLKARVEWLNRQKYLFGLKVKVCLVLRKLSEVPAGDISHSVTSAQGPVAHTKEPGRK